MCLAIYHPIGKKISKDNFESYCSSHPDGFGMLYVEDGKLQRYRTLLHKDFYEKYQTVLNLIGNKTPFVLHFRNSTGGTISLENCHPFLVSDTLGFVHNGVLSKIGSDTVHSDTYNFNEKILKPLAKNLENIPTVALIQDFVGKHNKFIFLDKDKKYCIINEKEGDWEEGIWYSSTRYCSRVTSYSSTRSHCQECTNEIDFSKKFHVTITSENYTTFYVCIDCVVKNKGIWDLLHPKKETPIDWGSYSEM